MILEQEILIEKKDIFNLSPFKELTMEQLDHPSHVERVALLEKKL